jgi:hypothetical protein
MKRVRYKDTHIYYTLKYTKRKKTIGIRITDSRTVAVHSPHGLSRTHIESLIMKKGEWILRHSAEKEYAGERASDNRVLYLGNQLKLLPAADRSPKTVPFAYVEGDTLFVPRNTGSPRESIIEFLRREAQKIVGERVSYFSENMHVRPLKIHIKNNRSIWGSCTPKKTLNFAYRIVMAPPEIIDYVVVHELAHLITMNHSKRFWEIVARYIPEVPKKRKWLRENETRLRV